MQRAAQAVVHIAALCGDEETGRSLVEPADKVRHAALAEITRQHRRKAWRGGVTRLRVHGDARRLVEHEQVVVLVDDVGLCRICAVQVLARRTLAEGDADNVARVDDGVDVDTLSVQ